MLLAVLGLTIVQIRPLLSVHLFVGMLLIPPVLLKMAATGYRFVRYYTSDPAYRRKGPPPAALRAIAPIVVLTTVVVFASGVALLFVGPSSRGTLLPVHKASFILWIAFMALHVIAHLPAIPEALRADYSLSAGPGGQASLSSDVTGRSGRVIALSGALVLGVVLAIITIPAFGAWVHATGLFHGH